MREGREESQLKKRVWMFIRERVRLEVGVVIGLFRIGRDLV